MSQKRSLTTGLFVASLSLAAGFAIMSSPNVASADDCGKLKVGAVKKVCKSGTKIKKAMKEAQKAARKDGLKIDGAKIKCTSCHKDANGGALKGDGAVKEFNKTLGKYAPFK